MSNHFNVITAESFLVHIVVYLKNLQVRGSSLFLKGQHFCVLPDPQQPCSPTRPYLCKIGGAPVVTALHNYSCHGLYICLSCFCKGFVKECVCMMSLAVLCVCTVEEREQTVASPLRSANMKGLNIFLLKQQNWKSCVICCLSPTRLL